MMHTGKVYWLADMGAQTCIRTIQTITWVRLLPTPTQKYNEHLLLRFFCAHILHLCWDLEKIVQFHACPNSSNFEMRQWKYGINDQVLQKIFKSRINAVFYYVFQDYVGKLNHLKKVHFYTLYSLKGHCPPSSSWTFKKQRLQRRKSQRPKRPFLVCQSVTLIATTAAW